MMSAVKKSIPEFYKKKNIFVTGGTGFLGTSLVEKLLRSFPQVDKIYLLVRGNKAGNVAERTKNYVNKKIFSSAKLYDRNCFSKIVWLQGDLSQRNCGLSPEAIETIQKDVHLVFHAGATINFQQTFKSILENNLRATSDLLDIFKDAKKLESFIYVSTAYSHSRRSRMRFDEKLYPPLVEPSKILQMVNDETTEEIQRKMSSLIQDSGNAYTFSKSASENLVGTYKEHFPIGIFRPGIITPSVAEPFPYWIQGNVAFERILREVSKGYILDFNRNAVACCIPVDMTVNAMIAAARDVNECSDKFKIYSFVAQSNPISYEASSNFYRNGIDPRTVAKKQFHYNYVIPAKKYLSSILKHKFDDVVRKERFELFTDVIRFFIDGEFAIDNTNVMKMWENLSLQEQRLLGFNVNNIDWKTYYSGMDKLRIMDY